MEQSNKNKSIDELLGEVKNNREIPTVNEFSIDSIPETELTEEEILESLEPKNEIDLLLREAKSKRVLDDDLSFTRKFRYGAAQETHALGNIYRQGKAFVNSMISDETYSEAARRIEAERQEDIFERFPEFRGKEEDAAVIAGRISKGFADPIALLIPWFRIARYGSTALRRTASLAGAGGAFTAGDAALREWSLTGKVSPVNIGAAAVIGGITTPLGGIITDKIRKAIPGGKVITVDENGNPVITNMSKLDAEDTLGDLSPEIQKGLELVSNDVYKVSGPYVARFSKNLESLGVIYNKRLLVRNDLKKSQKELDQLKRIGLDKQGELFEGGQIDEITKIINSQKKLVEQYQKEIDDILIKQMPEDLAIVGFESFKRAYQAGLLKGKVGEQLTRAFVQEAVRPILGGVGGFAVGTILGEDRNEKFLTAAIGAGIK